MLRYVHYYERIKYMIFFSLPRGRQILLAVAITISLVVVSYSINIKSSNALLGFGGQILMVVPCIDEASYAIIVGTPSPGVYIWTPATILIKHWNLWTPGPWVLGTYIPTPGLTCSDSEMPMITGITGVIKLVGTSMMPI